MSGRKQKILIVGAGMAGLAAARSLIAAGLAVTILEANDHIGGRTLTDYSLGFPCDLGAAWIHGIENNPIAELAQQLNLPHNLTQPELALTFDSKKHLIPQSALMAFDQQFQQLLKKVGEFTHAAKQDMSLLDALKANLTSMPKGDFSQEIYLWHLAFFSLYYGADAHHLSGRYWDLEEQLPGGNFLLTMGYQPIINYLAKNIPVILNTKVQQIDYDEHGVTISTSENKFIADAVIVTVPLGILKNNSIVFNPTLSAKKQASIAQLGMGLLNKVALRFPTMFWPGDVPAIRYITEHPRTVSAFVNYGGYLKKPILVGYMGGDLAKQLETLNDSVLIQQTMAELRKLFGHSIPEPEAHLVTRWGQNPSSFGSYSYVSVGAGPEDFDVLAEPVANRLFFAGEATHKKYFATTHGAYLSGLREAGRIINSKNCPDRDL